MRELAVSEITRAVGELCIRANVNLPQDLKDALAKCREQEDGPIARSVLDRITENYQIAQQEHMPICQDTGMACVFLEVGQEVHFTGGSLRDAVNEGVRQGTKAWVCTEMVFSDRIIRLTEDIWTR